ncbi:MAG: hypothetical protein H7061_00110 [Bdellovibrionaceae bacterium]|nr:hypothetical protein [Bdellovibrio sp.]
MSLFKKEILLLNEALVSLNDPATVLPKADSQDGGRTEYQNISGTANLIENYNQVQVQGLTLSQILTYLLLKVQQQGLREWISRISRLRHFFIKMRNLY